MSEAHTTTTKAPTLSIIVPVYNVAEYVSQCLTSIANQTFRDFEAIIVDDGSTDESEVICQSFSERDNRFRMLKQDNRGLSAARNAGISVATGRYIGFVDADDVIHPEMYHRLLTVVEQTNASIATCRHIDFCGGDKEAGAALSFCNPNEHAQIHIFDERDYWKNLFSLHPSVNSAVWNKIYRRELFEKVRFLEGAVYEDIDIIPRLMLQKIQIAATIEPLYTKRWRDNSISRDWSPKNCIDECEMRIRRGLYLEQRGWKDLAQKNAYITMSSIARLGKHYSSQGIAYREFYIDCRTQAIQLIQKSAPQCWLDLRFLIRAIPFLTYEPAYRGLLWVYYQWREGSLSLFYRLASITSRHLRRGE